MGWVSTDVEHPGKNSPCYCIRAQLRARRLLEGSVCQVLTASGRRTGWRGLEHRPCHPMFQPCPRGRNVVHRSCGCGVRPSDRKGQRVSRSEVNGRGSGCWVPWPSRGLKSPARYCFFVCFDDVVWQRRVEFSTLPDMPSRPTSSAVRVDDVVSCR